MGYTKRYYQVLLFILCINLPVFAGDDPVVTYKFENILLIDALDNLIYTHHIPIVYLKNQVDSVYITEQCSNCSPEEALKKILKNSVLRYKKVNNQFILYNPKQDKSEQKKEKSGIEGIVIDSLTREPLPYASIVIERMNKGASSNDLGVFKIDNLAPDLYKLKILYVGYTTDSIIADLRTPQKSRFLDIKLSSKNSELDAVVIKANTLKKAVATSDANTSTIDPKLLKTMPTPDPGDIIQNIKLLPGVSALPDNLGGFNLRGGAADQTLIQIDDIPLFHSGHLWGFNSSLNSDAIESVHILSGGFSARYGDRLSGVVDMKGKSAGIDGLHGGAYANLFSAKAYVATPITKKANLFFSVNSSTNFTGLNSKILNREDYMFFNQYIGATTSNDTKITAMGSIIPNEQKRFSSYYDLYAKLNLQLSNKDSLSVSCITNKDQITINSNVDTKYLKIKLTGERIENWQTSGIAMNNKHSWNNSISTNYGMVFFQYTNTSNFYYTPIQRDPDVTNSSSVSTNIIKQWNVYTNSQIHLSDFSQLIVGIEYNHINTGIERTGINGIETYTDSVGPINAFSNKVRNDEYIGFAENQLTIRRLKLTTGVRLTYNNILNLFLIEPRISSKVEISKGITAQASWGMFHQNFHNAPSIIAYNISSFCTTNVWLLSQKGLDPSQAQHWLAGITFDQKKWSVSLNAYYKKYSNLTFIIPSKTTIIAIDNSDPEAYQKYVSWKGNRKILPASYDSVQYKLDQLLKDDGIDYFTGSGYSKGIEVFITKKQGIHTGFISYNLSSTQYKFPYINMGNEFTADYDRSHELKIMNSFQRSGWTLGCLYTIISGKPYPGQFKVKSYYSESRIIVEHPLKWDLSNMQRTPPFQSVDLSLSKKFDKFKHFKLLIGTAIQNVFNFDNVLGRYYSLTTDETHNNVSVVNQQPFDQKGIGRLFNFFISVEF